MPTLHDVQTQGMMLIFPWLCCRGPFLTRVRFPVGNFINQSPRLCFESQHDSSFTICLLGFTMEQAKGSRENGDTRSFPEAVAMSACPNAPPIFFV